MCQFFSCVLTEKRVYAWTTDSHSDIIKEHNLKEWDIDRANLVKVEIVPSQEKGIFAPLAHWEVIFDQDSFPEWFCPETDKNRAIKALKHSGILKIRKKYEKTQQPAWAEYKKTQQSAWAEYEKIEQSALAVYEKQLKSIVKNPIG